MHSACSAIQFPWIHSHRMSILPNLPSVQSVSLIQAIPYPALSTFRTTFSSLIPYPSVSVTLIVESKPGYLRSWDRSPVNCTKHYPCLKATPQGDPTRRRETSAENRIGPPKKLEAQ